MSAACVSKAEFSDILKKVRAALGSEEGNTVTDLTYETLVDAYHVHSREHAIACMEDAEAALPRVDVLKERYGANAVTCAIFYWVCQLMEVRSLNSIFESITSTTMYRNPLYRNHPSVEPMRYTRRRSKPS